MLQLANLSKRYGDVVALDGCSFSVERGTMLGFLGPNGAGKTTTMRCIFNLAVPDAGTVDWDGRPVTPNDLLGFGYMPESRGLYPRMKILDQLAYIGTLHGMERTDAKDSAARWLELFGLSERRDDRLEDLSHGNQQRVQLAAALVHGPELLVLDEPFSGLDPLGVETMAEVLTGEAARGAAVVFSSHQLDLVEGLCEEVAIIHEGRIVLEGNVGQLKESAPVRHVSVAMRNGFDPDWVEQMPGLRSWRAAASGFDAVVDAETDVRALLRGVGAADDVTSFSFGAPTLNDLFREAVS